MLLPHYGYRETSSDERRRPTPTGAAGSAPRSRFLAPSLIGVVLFLVIPVIFVMVLSLTRWNLLTPIKWVGFSNYANIFRFDGFGHSLLVTAYYVLLNIPVQTVFALGLAMLLNSKRTGSALIRVICVLPFLATPVAMGVVWNWFFSPHRHDQPVPRPRRHHRARLAVGLRPPRCRSSRSPTSGSTPATTCCSSWPACRRSR